MQGILFDMESDVRDVKALSSALVMMVGGGNHVALEQDEMGAALDCVCYILSGKAEAVVRGWEAAFEAGKGGAA